MKPCGTIPSVRASSNNIDGHWGTPDINVLLTGFAEYLLADMDVLFVLKEIDVLCTVLALV